MKKWMTLVMAIMLVLSMSAGAIAQDAPGGPAAFTDEQMAAIEAAREALQKVEAEVLPKLVEAGALTQEALDQYNARQNGMGGGQRPEGAMPEGAMPEGEMPEGMTPPDDGQMPQGGRGGMGMSILDQVDRSKAPAELLEQLQAAQDAYQAAIQAAGIDMGMPQ